VQFLIKFVLFNDCILAFLIVEKKEKLTKNKKLIPEPPN
jgi:hypothetical protein